LKKEPKAKAADNLMYYRYDGHLVKVAVFYAI